MYVGKKSTFIYSQQFDHYHFIIISPNIYKFKYKITMDWSEYPEKFPKQDFVKTSNIEWVDFKLFKNEDEILLKHILSTEEKAQILFTQFPIAYQKLMMEQVKGRRRVINYGNLLLSVSNELEENLKLFAFNRFEIPSTIERMIRRDFEVLNTDSIRACLISWKYLSELTLNIRTQCALLKRSHIKRADTTTFRGKAIY